MSKKRISHRAALDRVTETLAEAWLTVPDRDLLDDAKAAGNEPEEVRSRVLEAFRKAKQKTAGGAATGSSHLGQVSRAGPMVLSIDAARARAILKAVAARTDSDQTPLRTAARLAPPVSDADAIAAVGRLRELGVVSDDDLNKD